MKHIKSFFNEVKKQNKYNALSTEIKEEVQVYIESSTSLYLTVPTQKIQITYLITLSQQDILSTEGGLKEDFSIEKTSSQRLVIDGNLKTALIILRHQGIISADKTQALVEDVNKRIDEEILDPSIKKLYENNYQIACDQFSPSAKEYYQRGI